MKRLSINTNNFQEIDIDKILDRNNKIDKEIENYVHTIINNVICNGDKALKEFTKKFDKAIIKNLEVSQEEIEEAYNSVDKDFLNIIEEAKENILAYHKYQKQETWTINEKKGITLGQLITPIDRVGVYVPGGKAGYPSTVLMDTIPAIVAGVSSIAMITPPDSSGKINPYILAASKIAGVSEIYKVGGAHGIAALAYGTESIAPVNKIVGPGNIFVATAKKLVFGKVDIDMIAGPSEICIIADKNSNPAYIAADMLSQAEHDEMASSILITTDNIIADKVIKEISLQASMLNRKDIIEKSLNDNGIIFIADSIDTAISLSNMIAPEHLEIMIDNPMESLNKIRNAGAIFLGDYSPEPIGDYFAGPNHTLPTSGTSKFSSPLGVYDFIKRSSIIQYDRENLKNVYKKVSQFAEIEGLDAHANAIRRRFND